MILLTIGTHEPFDRLVKIVDELSPYLCDEVVAQLSNSNYKVNNMKVEEFLSPAKFDQLFQSARYIISHAGMGTILKALESGKPIIVFPRLASFKETRNDHQVATCKKLDSLGYVYIAYDFNQLENLIFKGDNGELRPLHKVSKYASKSLIESIKLLLQ